MNKIFLLLTIFISFKCYSQNPADAIIGKWLKLPKENLIIQVFKVKDEYFGSINWTKDNDPKKPIDCVILKNLVYNKRSHEWVNGKITDPVSGKTYTAEAWIKPDGELEVNGYMGFTFFGIKKDFKRV